jgi:hypothetical protein
MLKWRLRAVVFGTAIAVLAPLGAAGATSPSPARIGSQSVARTTQSALPAATYAGAAVAPEDARTQLPFGRVDAALLALAGVPVLIVALRRRTAGAPARSSDPSRRRSDR